MSESERNESRFPCHVYEIADAKEAYDSFRGELIKEYGDDVTLNDGTVLHGNYMWDDGSRYIDDNTLSVHMSRLREKVGAEHIQTVRGVGYQWSDI